MINTVYTYTTDPEIVFTDSVYHCVRTSSYEECFKKAMETNAEIIIQAGSPISEIHDFLASLENYDSLLSMLVFYEYNDETILYSISNVGKNICLLKDFFVQNMQRKYINVFDSFYDLDQIISNNMNDIEIRIEQTKRYECLIELSRGMIKSEFYRMRDLYNFNLKDNGYYIYAFMFHDNSDFDYIHHMEIKNIYYLIGAIRQKECQKIIDEYDGGEVFYDGTRKLFVIINANKAAKHTKRLNEQVEKLNSILGTMDSNRYLSEYIEDIEAFREKYEALMELKNYTFFLRDAKLITKNTINTIHKKPNFKIINEYLEKIQSMLLYDISNPQIISLIQALMLVIVKPTNNIDVFFYCYANLYSMLYQRITLGYHSDPAIQMNINPNIYRSFIEVECNRLCEIVQSMQSQVQLKIPVSKNSLVNQAIDYIKKNYDKDISIVTLSDQLNISSVYLSQLFKKETGTSPLKFIIEYRIEQAKYLLIKSDEPINNIAIRVGFWEQKYFSRSFKKLTGLTPTQYRKQFVSIYKKD